MSMLETDQERGESSAVFWKAQCMAARKERDELKKLIACALASISGDETVSWPQPHPELLTRCAAAHQTMRDMGNELNELKARLAACQTVLRAWRHWYVEDSTEFNRDSAYFETVKLLECAELEKKP